MGHRDIVWITLESVRQDHTTGGGYVRDTTPNLARIGRSYRGAEFHSCYSHDIWTRPSTASILTGRASSDHRTWHNEARLSSEIETIPERLTDAGYQTVGISPIGQFSESTGLHRGFDQFHYLGTDTLVSEAGIGTVVRYLANLRRHSAGLTTETQKHSIGYLSNEIAKRHVRRAGRLEEPLFLYLHHGDSHHVYWPPKGWQERFADDLELPLEEALALARSLSDALHEHIANGVPFEPAELRAIEAMYDTMLAYVDHLAGDFAEYAIERLDDPIVVITADHGELFGELDCLAHMLVTHTAVSNVPLVTYGLDDCEPDGLVQHADVMQLLLEECGIEAALPAATDISSGSREFAVVQRSGARTSRKLEVITDHNAGFDASRFPPVDQTSLVTDRFRYQVSGERTELFELPDEETDVSDAYADVSSTFEDAYRDWSDQHVRTDRSSERAEFSPEMRKHLEDLGYV